MADHDYFAVAAHPRTAPGPAWRRPARPRVALALALVVGLALLKLHVGSPASLAAGTGVAFPPAGVGESARPLGAPPAVLPVPEGTSYRFLYKQDDGVTPVTWSPCRAIHYVTRQAHQPPGGAQLVRDAFAEVSRATGLVWVDDGSTTEAPSADRSPYQPDRYGKRWAPVLVTWAGADEVPDLRSDVIGEAGALPVRTRSGDRAFVTGVVNLDFAQMSAVGARGRYDETRAVVLHELGHLVGLDHVSDPVQVMFPSDGYLPSEYAMGDRAGLAALGRGACQPDI